MYHPIAAATAAAGLLLGYSTAVFAGTSFTQVTTVDGQRVATTKIVADGGNAKAEFVETAAENPFMPAGSYMLIAGGDMYLVNPAARTYSRFDTAMLEGMSQMMGRMEISDVAFEKVLDEAGESILGHPTRHYQFKSSWSMGMQGMPMKTELSVVEDLWVTTAVAMPEVPTAFAGGAGGMPEQVQALVDAQGSRNVDGFPLKQVSVQTTKMNMGALGGLGARMAAGMAGAGGGATTTTIEVTELAQVDVPAATFELPAGYQETAPFQNGPALPSLNEVQEAPAVPNLNDLN
jgi:hypothetical protein